jgi:hypothetical protein
VGSTERELKQRFSKHRNKSHAAPNRRIYKAIIESGGFDVWKMELLESIETDNMLTRRTREQYWIDELQPELNSVRVLG